MLTRRDVLKGLIALAAAPAIVKAESIMKIKPLIIPAGFTWDEHTVATVSLEITDGIHAGDYLRIYNADTGEILVNQIFKCDEDIITLSPQRNPIIVTSVRTIW